jgi:hypothetical protein
VQPNEKTTGAASQNYTKREEGKIPDFIRRHLMKLSLLPGESVSDYLEIYDNFNVELAPKTLLDHIQLGYATDLVYDLFRYHRMKVSTLNNGLRAAVEEMYRKTHEGAAMPGASAGVAFLAAEKAARWPADAAARKKIAAEFAQLGYPEDAIETLAFALVLPTLARIETLIASAQKRLNSYLKDLADSNDKRAAGIQRVAERAIASAAAPPRSH